MANRRFPDIVSFLAYLLIYIQPGAAGSDLPENVWSPGWAYEFGVHGLFPLQTYRTFEKSAPLINFKKWDDRCDDGGLIFIATRGDIVSKPGPVITDAKGNLIWTDDKYTQITDFRMQTWKGKNYLTFWSAIDGHFWRHGKGAYYMLDESYNVVRIVEAKGEGIRGDMHDFEISQDDTALFTIYTPKAMDLTPIGGPEKGWITDSGFQELDIETGELLFDWRASDHIPVDISIQEAWGAGGDPMGAFDYFHINTVSKDDKGNYLVSGRHASSLVYLNGTSGEPLWYLGGKKNSFEDLSNGEATDFLWQHDGRIHNGDVVTVFDNARSEWNDLRHHDYSRGLVLDLDTEAMTVKVQKEYFDTDKTFLSRSQGSFNILDNGKALMGYGWLPMFAEFSEEGEMLCRATFAPVMHWELGFVNSYRTQKSYNWVGKPNTSPSISLNPEENHLYVSWLGATEIAKWSLEGGQYDDVAQKVMIEVQSQDKVTFEQYFEITDDMPPYLRVTALDKDGNVLGHSEVVSRQSGNEQVGISWATVAMMAFMALIASILLLIFRQRLLMLVQWLWSLTPGSSQQSWWREQQHGRDYERQPLYDER